MADTFAVDLASGPYFQLPKLFVGGKQENFNPEMLAYDQTGGSQSAHTADGLSMQQLVLAAAPDFMSWSATSQANYDNYDPHNVNHTEWKALLDAALLVVNDATHPGAGIAPGFQAHGVTAPTVMGSYSPTPSNTPELLTNVASSTNDYAKEQAGKWLTNTIVPAVSGDLSKIVGVEISNEPGTNNPQQYWATPSTGAGNWPSGLGWYNDPSTQGTLEEDFHTNIFKVYADYFTGLFPGIKVQGYSYSYGARATATELASLTRFVNCYPGSRPDQVLSGGKNLSSIGLLALHGYTQISTGGIAGANANDPQQAWNTLFHVTSPYDITKDGMVSGFNAKRALLDTLGGTGVSLHFSEQWMISGSGTTQNSIQAMMDVLGFIGAVQNAHYWYRNGAGGYTVQAVNTSVMPGVYDATTSWPSANDFMFGYGSNAYVLHRTGRYYVWKSMLCGFGNRFGYQRLLNVTQSSSNSPATVLSNAVPRIQGVAGLNAAGTQFAMLVANIDMTNSTSVGFSWTGSACTGAVTGLKWAGNGSVQLDTDLTSLGTLATTGANSFSLTMAAGDCVIIFVPVSASAGGSVPGNLTLPTVSGLTVQGSALTGGDGTWTNTPTGTTRQWYRCDPNGANPASIGGATSTMYTLTSGDVGFTLRFGVVESNAAGASSLTYSNPTGVITGSGSGGTSTPTVVGTATVVPLFGNSDSRSITVPSLTNGLLTFVFHGKSAGDILSTLTLGGTSLTQLVQRDDGGESVEVEMWYMLAPAAGTHTLAWTKTGSAQNIGYSYTFWSGVDQTHPFGNPAATPVTDQAASTAILGNSLSANANDVLLAAATFNVAAATPTDGPGQTSLYASNQSTTQFCSSYVTASASGVVQLTERPSAGGANGAFVLALLHGIATGAPPVNNSAPVVTGSPVELQVLTCSPGSWNDPSATFGYQWQASDPVTISWSNISAATSSTFSLTSAQDGKIVRCEVVATNTFGSSTGVPSQQTATITSPGSTTAPTDTVAPVASGVPDVGAVVTCDPGTYEASHPPTSFTYEWRRE